MIAPLGGEVYHSLKVLKGGGYLTCVGDKGSFALDAMDLIVEAI